MMMYVGHLQSLRQFKLRPHIQICLHPIINQLKKKKSDNQFHLDARYNTKKKICCYFCLIATLKIYFSMEKTWDFYLPKQPL